MKDFSKMPSHQGRGKGKSGNPGTGWAKIRGQFWKWRILASQYLQKLYQKSIIAT